MKVVFHIDDISKWSELRSNVYNLLKADEEIQVVVLVNGAAIIGYVDTAYQHFFSNQKISFHACNNAMRAHDLLADQLPKSVRIVPSGVLNLVELQKQGFAYIKP